MSCLPNPTDDIVALHSAIVTNASLQLKVLTAPCPANQVQSIFQVVNTGSTGVKLSDIKIKVWADDSSGQALVPQVNTGGCASGANNNPSCVHQVTAVTAAAASFTPACGPDANHQANWEVTISTTDNAILPAGATWNNLQVGSLSVPDRLHHLEAVHLRHVQIEQHHVVRGSAARREVERGAAITCDLHAVPASAEQLAEQRHVLGNQHVKRTGPPDGRRGTERRLRISRRWSPSWITARNRRSGSANPPPSHRRLRRHDPQRYASQLP